MKRHRWIILIALLFGGCVTLEIIAGNRLDPTGRAATLSQYLTWRPGGQRFSVVEADSKQHVIAYGPRRSWLLLSSGPSAYVFDDTGRLVDWSDDIGDDPEFDERWNAQRSQWGHTVTRTAVASMAATRPTQ